MVDKTLTRADLSLALHKKTGISLNESKKIVGQFFDAIIIGLQATGEVKLTHFGTFYYRNKDARMGRNPKTLEPALITARRVVSFKPADKLKEVINKDD